MQRACRVPLGSGWSADDPDPGARAGKPTPSMAAICATNSAARRCGGGPAAVPATPSQAGPFDDESPVPPAGLLFGPCNQASATRLMQRACWHLRGLRGRQARRSRGAGKPAPSVGWPAVTQRGRGFRSRKPYRKPRRSGALTVLMHVGDTPRSLTTLNRGSGSTNWVGFCGKRHVRLKPSNVERG